MTTFSISNTSKERLTQMIRVLNAVNPKGFDLGTWFGDPTVVDAQMLKKLQNSNTVMVNPADCGTTACACGSAALDPWFISRGFHLQVVDVNHSVNIVYGCNAATSLYNWSAVMSFFDLTSRDADRLFMDVYYKNVPRENLVQEVIRRIRFYLNGGNLIETFVVQSLLPE